MPVHTKEPTLPWNYIAKLVCIGDSSTGKSSLTTRLCEGRFSASHDVTIGVEFGSRIVNVGPPANAELGINAGDADVPSASENASPAEQKKMKLSLWDTAGQETYKSVTRSYFRGASGALLVFDITRRSTFDAVTGWLNDLRQIAEKGIVIVLVGNKLDLADHTTNLDGGNRRAVTKQEAEDWCKREGIVKYIETSAKSGENVERAFLEVAERIYQNIEAGKYDLNDRRSGVKSYGTGTGRDVTKPSQNVTLSLNDAVKGKSGSSCC